MKKRHSGRKTSWHPSSSPQQLDVKQPSSPPPSPANQPKTDEEKEAGDVKEDLEKVKEILRELPKDLPDQIVETPQKEEPKIEEGVESKSNENEEKLENKIDLIPKEEKPESIPINKELSIEIQSDPEISHSERPVDVVGMPTALRSPNRQHQKNSVGAKVAFIEPVRSVKKHRRRTQKISFENMREVELKKTGFLEVCLKRFITRFK